MEKMRVRIMLRCLTVAMFILICTVAGAQQDGAAAVSAPQAQADSTRTSIVDFNAAMADYDNPTQYIINDIAVSGIKYLNPEIIIDMAGINRGDTIVIPSDYLSSATRKLMEGRYFSDVQIFAQPLPDSELINLEIYLLERPRVLQWDYTGVFKSEKKDLQESLKLRRGSELSDFVLNSSVGAIKKYLAEKGYLNAEVDIIQTNDTTVTTSHGVNVTFAVTKNERVRVGDITFEGNSSISSKKLRKSFKKIHKVGINFIRNSKLKEVDYAEDKANLVDYYQSKGYRNALIVSDSIYPINPKRIGIHIKVEEGNKFYYRDVTWTGNSVYGTPELNAMVAVEKGTTYDKSSLHKRLGVGREVDAQGLNVASLYQNNGYLFSSIEPVETVVGADSIDIDIKIFEGNQARVNDVRIAGNLRVDDQVIRRELYVRPGELYDRSMLMQTMQQLNQMQHFFETSTVPQILSISNDMVDIAFNLEEQASDKFDISGGWGSSMFVGSVGVQLNNISIKRMFKKDAWRPYPSGQGQSLGVRFQTNGTYYKSLSLSFTEPWLGGKKPNSLSVGLYYSDQNDAYWIGQSSSKHFRTLGVSAGLGHRLSWPDRYFTLYNEISYQAYMLKDWDNFVVENGTSNIIQLKTTFGRKSVDHPIYPRSGSDFSISVALTPPYSLWDGKDYASGNLSETQRYGLVEFHKWKLKGEWYYPVTRDNKLILMAKTEMGYLGSYDRNKVSPFEGFEVGGDGMSGYNVYGVDIIAMRGYANGALTEYDYSSNSMGYSRAYNKYTVELRYPLIIQPRSTIFALAFAEAGNAFNSWKAFDPFSVKRSLGVGVRMYLPMIGLVGFDLGYGFDRAVNESGRSGFHPHFMMGAQF